MTMMRRVFALGAGVVVAVAPALPASADETSPAPVERHIQRSEVYWEEPGPGHGLEEPVGGARATLLRVLAPGGAHLRMRLVTNGLHPGHAYTVWWAIHNRPEACSGIARIPGGTRCGQLDWAIPAVESTTFAAAGAVAEEDGTATFVGRIAEGDDRVHFENERGRAFSNPRGADIVLWVRDHGPYDPAAYGDEQLTTFNGGCANYLPGGSGEAPGDYPCSNQQVASFGGLA